MADLSKVGRDAFAWVDAGDDEPAETAARRVRGSVGKGSRDEGRATLTLEKLGRAILDTALLPKRLIDAAATMEPGESVADRQDVAKLVAETALNVVGAPGLTGGVPLSALGSGMKRMSRNGMVENAEILRVMAQARRNEGRGSTGTTYRTQEEFDRARGGSPSKESFERATQEAKAGWQHAKGEAQEDFRRAVYPERFPKVVDTSTETLADLFARYRSKEDFFLPANMADRRASAVAVGADDRQ